MILIMMMMSVLPRWVLMEVDICTLWALKTLS